MAKDLTKVEVHPFTTAMDVQNNLCKSLFMDADATRIVTVESDISVGIQMQNAFTVNSGKSGSPRPLTYEIPMSILESYNNAKGANYTIASCEISDVVEGVWYGILVLQDGEDDDSPIEVDVRASDAAAIAAHLQIPLKIDAEVFEEISKKVPNFVTPEVKARFRATYDGTAPETEEITKGIPRRRDTFSRMVDDLDLTNFKDHVNPDNLVEEAKIEQDQGLLEQAQVQQEENEDGEAGGKTIYI